MKRIIYWLCVVSLLLPTRQTSATIKYNVVDLGTLGGTISAGWNINNRGQVTGVSYLTAGYEVNHAFLWTPTSPNGNDGTLLDLGTLGGRNSVGHGINDDGQVVGYSDATGSFSRSFMWTQIPNNATGTMQNLATIGGITNQAFSINDSGQVVGFYGGPNAHAFQWTPTILGGATGTMHDLGTLGGTSSHAYGVNAKGQVTGDANITNGESHAFVWTPDSPGGASGTMSDLGTLGGTLSIGWGINAGGQVTGFSKKTGDIAYHAFLWTPTSPNGNDGTLLDLGTLAGERSYGYGINAIGHVTGGSTAAGSDHDHAFLYTAETGLVDLNTLIDPLSGWMLNAGTGINDVGQITGQGLIRGETHAFLLTPVPEPNSFALAVIGAAGLVLLARRKRINRQWISNVNAS